MENRQRLIAGNWKLNGSRSSVVSLSENIAKAISKASSNAISNAAETQQCEVVLCPSAIHLADVLNIVGNTAIKLGAQDCSEYSIGAFTGECSAEMLVEFGCEYVIVGHSERRALFGDTDSRVDAKFAAVQNALMTPIFCVGESLEHRQAGQHMEVIAAQLDTIVNSDLPSKLGVKRFSNAVIAYEPIWAIGTGETASPSEAQAVHEMIREKLGKLDAGLASQLRIIYGGSVNPGNAQTLFTQPDIDGALVGGASLKAEDFVAICHAG